MTALRLAIYLALSLVVGMSAREYARSLVATRLGDPTPRLWGRLTMSPRAWFDPFGSGLLPGLILILWASSATFLPPPIAYAKPAPVDPSYFRHRTRDTVLTAVAGPVANVVLAAVVGIVLRAGFSGDIRLALAALVFVNLCLAVFHLLPIPGLDGARIVGLFLPPRAAELYRNADQYLALFALVALFLFAGPLTSIVYSLVGSLCRLLAGAGAGCRV